jgi:hypothetical protein
LSSNVRIQAEHPLKIALTAKLSRRSTMSWIGSLRVHSG